MLKLPSLVYGGMQQQTPGAPLHRLCSGRAQPPCAVSVGVCLPVIVSWCTWEPWKASVALPGGAVCCRWSSVLQAVQCAAGGVPLECSQTMVGGG